MHKNPLYNGNDLYMVIAKNEIFDMLSYKTNTAIVAISYSKQGVATAWRGYSDEKLSTASGYGYDKQSQCLSLAIEKLTGLEIGGYGMGAEVVKRLSKEKHNIEILEFRDLYTNPHALQYSKNDTIKRLAKGIIKQL